MESIARSEKGFAIVAALMAILVLTAVGLLVFAVSTQDIRISGRVIGEKKAFSAMETGIHRFVQSFDPANLAASVVPDGAVDPGNDPNSRYTVETPGHPASGPSTIPITGYAILGGQAWGQERFDVRISGRNTNYNSLVRVEVGAGYGPIEISTAYR